MVIANHPSQNLFIFNYLILSAALTNASSANIALLAIKYNIKDINGNIEEKDML